MKEEIILGECTYLRETYIEDSLVKGQDQLLSYSSAVAGH